MVERESASAVSDRGRGRVNCLDGYVVVDLTAYLAGPFGTDILSALGARVIKVEPLEGDFQRISNAPFISSEGCVVDRPAAGEHYVTIRFLKRNRAKESVALNLKSPQGKDVLRRLVEHADAFVHNYKPSTVRKLGVTSKDIQQMNPRVVYVGLDGLGAYAEPGDERPAIDYTAQALSGLTRYNAETEETPRIYPFAFGDTTGGMYAAIAVLAGLLGRDGRRSSERGSSFSVSMLGALSSHLWELPWDAIAGWKRDETLKHGAPGTRRVDSTAYLVLRLFKTSDSKWVCICGISQDQWVRIVRATGIPELANETYLDLATRLADKERIERLLDAWAAELTGDEMLARLVAGQVSAWPVYGATEMMADQRFRETFLYEIEHPVYGPTGMYHAVSPIVADNPDDAMEDAPAPLKGQHTHSILAEIGFTDDEIEELEAKCVIGR